MKCKRVSGLISDYLDGLLAESVSRDLESHLARCPECASEVEATKGLLASLSSLSGQRSPVNCWDHVHARILADAGRRDPWWRWALRPVVAAPAAAVMAMLVMFLLWPVPPTASNMAPEYVGYIAAHSHLQRQQAFVDADVVFVGAEVQKASLTASTE